MHVRPRDVHTGQHRLCTQRKEKFADSATGLVAQLRYYRSVDMCLYYSMPRGAQRIKLSASYRRIKTRGRTVKINRRASFAPFTSNTTKPRTDRQSLFSTAARMQLDMQVLPGDSRHNNTRLVTTNRWCFDHKWLNFRKFTYKSRTTTNVFDNALVHRQGTSSCRDSQGFWLQSSSGFSFTGQNACSTCIRATDISNLGAGIATRYGLESPGIESRWGRDFPPVQTGPGVHPASYTTGTGSFPGVRWTGRGDDHPPHLAPRLKKE